MTLMILACLGLFLLTYLINITMITVFYHRGLAHKAVVLGPRATKFVATMGIWLTGLDPKAWVCMHRAHHKYSDGPEDPHSPVRFGVFGVFLGQLRSYERTLIGLAKREAPYTELVNDLDFDINILNKKSLWLLPYITHAGIAVALAWFSGFWLLGLSYWIGMMSHPIQGWMVNSLGHALGGRNFPTKDNSRNNQVTAWLVMGEGYQNNHHAFPASAKFSYRRREVDMGYALCRSLQTLGILKIRKAGMIPKRGEARPVLQEELALTR